MTAALFVGEGCCPCEWLRVAGTARYSVRCAGDLVRWRCTVLLGVVVYGGIVLPVRRRL